MAISAAFKAKWVKALRSGKFEQTDGTLKDKDGYCCLGVACHLLGIADRALEKTTEGYGQTWLAPQGFSLEASETLASMNDDGKSFRAIASYIEKRKGI